MDINTWIKEIHATAKEKGWWDSKRNTAEMLMLIVTELGEACEADRKGIYGYEEKDTFEDEIADAVIRIFDMCGGLGIDLEKQMKWKTEFNKTRKKKHGKKY